LQLGGGTHVWNCFLPRDGGSDVRLFDWDTWRLGVAAEDLACMMAVHWYPDRRRPMERPLLDPLSRRASSAWGQRLRPARFGRRLPFVRAGAYRDAGLSSANIPTVIWWNNFERIHMAVEDLGCRELLE
jgi:hypothetical protein